LFSCLERAKANEQKEKVSSGVMLNTDTTTTTKQSSIDSSTLSRLVDARLHLPVSQRLLEKFKLAVIKRSLEDQLRIKRKLIYRGISFKKVQQNICLCRR
jgi:hypothetical protein